MTTKAERVEFETFIAQIDEFPDGSARSLVTLTARGQADTETWERLDVTGDVAQQHADLAKRLHRLMKVRIRHLLNDLTGAAKWQRCTDALAQGITTSGFDLSKMSFRALLATIGEADIFQLLEACAEEARVAGFVTDEELAKLLQHEQIATVLDPRPSDVAAGPPLVVEEAC